MSLNTSLVKNLQYVLSNFEIFLVLLSLSWLYGGLTYCFSQSRQLDCIQHLFMHFAPQIHTLQRATALSSSSSVTKKRPVWLNIVVYAGI